MYYASVTEICIYFIYNLPLLTKQYGPVNLNGKPQTKDKSCTVWCTRSYVSRYYRSYEHSKYYIIELSSSSDNGKNNSHSTKTCTGYSLELFSTNSIDETFDSEPTVNGLWLGETWLDERWRSYPHLLWPLTYLTTLLT